MGFHKCFAVFGYFCFCEFNFLSLYHFIIIITDHIGVEENSTWIYLKLLVKSLLFQQLSHHFSAIFRFLCSYCSLFLSLCYFFSKIISPKSFLWRWITVNFFSVVLNWIYFDFVFWSFFLLTNKGLWLQLCYFVFVSWLICLSCLAS